MNGILIIAIIFGFVMSIVPVLVYLERRISARIQHRLGPNRVGLPKLAILGPLSGFHMWGLLQPLADAAKFVFKEDFVPASADKTLYKLSPLMVMIPAALGLAAIPFAGETILGRLVIFDAEIGVLFVLAVTALGVHGLTIAGWASNNKFGQMGGVRASAQLISYEAAMFIALLAALMSLGTTNFFDMVANQEANGWLFWRQPIAFIVFYICIYAETNRLPFDMAEAEPELVGGFHTEYGGMRFALFFLGEYIAMVNQCAILTLVFLGGWTFPGIDHGMLGGFMGFFIFISKVLFLLMVMIQVRWTLPRFRYDQLMTLGWKRLTPIAMANLALTAIIGVFLAN